MNPHDIKHLQVRLTKARAEEDAAKAEAEIATEAHSQATRHRRNLEQQLTAVMVEPVLTEHALLRYIERSHGIDLEHIKSVIMTDANKRAINVIVSGKLPIGNGLTAVIKNKTIVSITK
jgi:hypothetical protein